MDGRRGNAGNEHEGIIRSNLLLFLKIALKLMRELMLSAIMRGR